MSAARAAVAHALQVKLPLHIDDGRVAMLEKVRSASRALARLTEIATEFAASRPVNIAIHHLCAGARAANLAANLRTRLQAASVVADSQELHGSIVMVDCRQERVRPHDVHPPPF